jgi:cupin 2 domain-containing protein
MENFNKIIEKYKKDFIFEEPLYNNTEKTFILFEDEKIKIEKIISYGFKNPDNFWYDQNEKEYVYIMQGNGRLLLENQEIELKQGDTFIIEAHIKHRVSFSSLFPPCVWLCMFVK